MKIVRLLVVILLSTVIFVSPVYACESSVITNEQFEDILLLAKLINGEAGANWCGDEMRYGVGNVAMNRVRHEEFPNTLKEVIYQDGQYGCLDTKAFQDYPPQHCINIATNIILQDENSYPPNVVYQSNQPLGHGIHEHIKNMYFCYK